MIDAMVFAAGLGIRLRPLTLHAPKALVRVGGMSVLERAVRTVAGAGADRIVVNAHAHLDRMEAEVVRLQDVLRGEAEAGGRPPPKILLSAERERPLETGGGLRCAAGLFRGDRPILMHNADVLSEVDLAALVADHGTETRRLATLAVHVRDSSRLLEFDHRGLCGRVHRPGGRRETVRASEGPVRALAFTGLHVASARLLQLLPEADAFSIVDHYLRLAAAGERIAPFDAGKAGWWEIGTPRRLAAARRAFPDPAGRGDRAP